MVEDWWLYWPVTYLAAGKPVHVIDGSAVARGRLPRDPVWLVFAGGPLDRCFAATPGTESEASIAGTGRAVLRIWRRVPDNP